MSSLDKSEDLRSLRHIKLSAIQKFIKHFGPRKAILYVVPDRQKMDENGGEEKF